MAWIKVIKELGEYQYPKDKVSLLHILWHWDVLRKAKWENLDVVGEEENE